jgi:aryl-alcohol dehydrogenase-like predicted oxidoreductase
MATAVNTTSTKRTLVARLGLGTVQFGMDYGVTNSAARTPADEVAAILGEAGHAGIALIDTAPAYGISEEVLGQRWPEGHRFQVVSKTPVVKARRITPDDARDLETTFLASLSRLRLDRMYGLLVHHADNLLAEHGELLLEAMRSVQERRLVAKIGVSVYSGQELDAVLRRFTPDVVQLPISVFDQRLIASGHLRELARRGVEIHARSAFLQGVLLADPAGLGSYFDPIKPLLRQYGECCAKAGLSALRAALEFFNGVPEVSYIVVGTCSHAQLRELLEAARSAGAPSLDYKCWACADEQMVNPSMWKV